MSMPLSHFVPAYPSPSPWWHIYTMEYFSAIKRNEIELFVVRWIDLESVIQSEVSQKEKNKYHMLTHKYGIYLPHLKGNAIKEKLLKNRNNYPLNLSIIA